MKNVMQSLAGVLLFAGLAACGSPRPGALGASKKIVPATIFLTGPNATSCSAKVAPGTVQVGMKEDVDWTIIDLCGGTQGYSIEVELRWSADNTPCEGTNKSPLDGDPKGTKNIKRGINQKCKAEMKFNYGVYLNGTLLADPELEIVQ